MDPLLSRVIDEAHGRQLPVLIDEWAHTDDHRRWIARALRLDLALLDARPELVVPCLYRRCAMFDDTAFFHERPPLPADAAALVAWSHAAVEAWRPDQHWLRALRTPPVPLDGAAIEEYRTSARGPLWCSADGERIGVGSIAWERSTGRRVDGAPPTAAPATEPWNVMLASTWGKLLLERSGYRVTIAYDNGDNIRAARTISERHVLVDGWDGDSDNFHGVVDTRSARLLWRAPGRPESMVVLDDDRVLVARWEEVCVIAVTTGEVLEKLGCPYIGELVLLPGGDFATRAGQVIRVWDRELARAPQVWPNDARSWIPAGFSPDGTRLVTDRLLCDARTGRWIATLDCDGPGYIEGGPPDHSQRLCDGVFVELKPFGFAAWDSATGAQLVRDREQRATQRDTVAFDATGRCYATWDFRGNLRLLRVRDGGVLRELVQPVAGQFESRQLGFSADGQTLAWDTPDGARWAIATTGDDDPRRLDDGDDPREAPEPSIAIEDGLLVIGTAAIPCDDERAVASPDGVTFAGRGSHYRLER